MFISKGTLENVIDGYGFITNQDISNKQDKLIAGANISIASDGKTISATNTTYNEATTSTSGLMSSSDKTKLNGIASGAEVNVQANWNETNSSSDAYIQNKPEIPNVEEYNNLLYKTLDLTNADKIFTGYIYNGAYSGNQNWRSYEFKAQNIDKIISLSAYTDSSSYKNINFYSKYCSHSSELSSYFISSVPLNEGANKINTYSNIIVPDNCEAIVISHKIQSNMETPIVSLREKKYDKEIEDINSDIKEISNSASNVKAIYKNIWNANDFIFIKDELWLAKPNSTYTGYDQEIRRYKMIDDEWVEQSKLYTDFGHWNTVDYCPENDCLIFGNGANAETTTGNYFTVVKNPLALSGSVLTQDVGIKYNVDIGFKVQAVWGNDNMGEYNIVYLTSNYTRRIVKLLLGKDTNGNFDGTFITLSDTTLPTTIGTGGGDFWGDCIYIGDGASYAIWKLSVTDYTVQKIDRTAYLSDGTIISGSTQGIYIDKDYIWVFYNIGTSSNNYLVQYYRGGLTNKSVTTDAHINDLIDAKLGVIENGSY
jgi:hypothetical protein